MTTPVRERAWYRLAAHFFQSLFDFGFLSEEGAEAFTRVVIGFVSLVITFGLLVARLYMGRYAGLPPDEYARALVADETMMLAFPMFAVAIATVLVSASLFPTETDYRVLVPLPIRRRTIFGAKLLSLIAFLGMFVAAFAVSLGPLFMVVSHGRWQVHSFLARLLANSVTGVIAAAFAALAITMVFGVITLCAPRARFRVVSGIAQTLLLCALVIVLPWMVRLPAYASLYTSESRIVRFVPPAWFLGIDRMLLGERDPLFVELAAIGQLAFGVVLLVVFACYAILYRRFDHVLTRPDLPRARKWRLLAQRHVRTLKAPARSAILAFTSATIARSALHRGVCAAIATCGFAYVVNSLIGSGLVVWLVDSSIVGRRLFANIAWAPFPLIFAAVFALRASLVLPIEQRANWIFRMTEAEATRRQQLGAVERVFFEFGVGVPIAVLSPLEWLAFGAASLRLMAVAALSGAILVELVLFEWRRLPFSSSYMPGKRGVGLTLLAGFAAISAFSSIGSGLGMVAIRGYARGVTVVFSILFGLFALMRYRRLRTWGRIDLLFDDELPEDITPIRLN